MWVQDHARVERDEQGRARRVYGVTMDVTEHKRAEELIEVVETLLEEAPATPPGDDPGAPRSSA